LLNKTNLGVTILMALFSSAGASGNGQESLKNGELILANKTRGLIILEWIKDWVKFYQGGDRRSFIYALIQLHNIKGYSHDKMMQKIKYQSTKLVDCTNTKTYLALLEEIYNFKERGKKLRFF